MFSKKSKSTVDVSTKTSKNKFTQLWDYLFHTKNGRFFLGALVLIIGTGIGLILYILANTPASILSSGGVPQKEQPTYSPLTGIELSDPSLAEKPVVAVMIENNYPESRPQSGLKNAGIVYEAVAEAGITRFLVLYQETLPDPIGPVRSLRPYYTEWVSAYDAAVAHVGGSARALKMIRSGDYGTDIDQFFNADAYWRAGDRAAPHNVYTNKSRLEALLKAKNKSSSNFTGFERKTGKPVEEPSATKISIGISDGNYAVSYRYNKESNNYTRYHGDQKHNDREKGTITPAVVIGMKVPAERSLEDGYRESITTTGSEEAVIFQNGEAIKGTWVKKSHKDPLFFKDADDEVIALNRGQTWITALDNDRNISWQ